MYTGIYSLNFVDFYLRRYIYAVFLKLLPICHSSSFVKFFFSFAKFWSHDDFSNKKLPRYVGTLHYSIIICDLKLQSIGQSSISDILLSKPSFISF